MSPRPARSYLESKASRRPTGATLHELNNELRLLWFVLARREAWPGMHQPFNGQVLRLKTVRALIDSFEPDAFVETGTFIGSTTRFFLGNGAPVFTVEVKRLFWLLARLRLGWDRDVKVLRVDSRTALKRLAQQRLFARPLVYVDAHWWDDFPLDDELNLIFTSWEDAVAIVDDFQVEGDSGYAFDTYKGTALALSAVHVPDGVMLAGPAQSSSEETGARRGALYLAKGARAERALEDAAMHGLLRLL